MKSRDLVLDQTIVDTFRQWVRESTRRDVAVISSELPGCGITTMIKCVCAEESIDPVHMATSIPQARAFLKDASRCPVSALGFKKILVVDPMDAVCFEPLCAADLTEFIKSAKTKIPLIFAGHVQRSSASKLVDALKTTPPSVITRFHFPRIDDTKALLYLAMYRTLIASSAHVRSAWQGDFRNALNAIRLDVPRANKDVFCDGLVALQKLLTDPSMTFREALRLHSNDISMLSAGVHENYLLVPTQSIESCADLAECFSAGDVFDTEMYAHQKWELGGAQSACTAGATAVLSAKAVPKTQFSKFGTMWSRGNNQRSKVDGFRPS